MPSLLRRSLLNNGRFGFHDHLPCGMKPGLPVLTTSAYLRPNPDFTLSTDGTQLTGSGFTLDGARRGRFVPPCSSVRAATVRPQ